MRGRWGAGVLEELQNEHLDEDEGRVDCREDSLDRILELFAALWRFELVRAECLEDDAVGACREWIRTDWGEERGELTAADLLDDVEVATQLLELAHLLSFFRC